MPLFRLNPCGMSQSFEGKEHHLWPEFYLLFCLGVPEGCVLCSSAPAALELLPSSTVLLCPHFQQDWNPRDNQSCGSCSECSALPCSCGRTGREGKGKGKKKKGRERKGKGKREGKYPCADPVSQFLPGPQQTVHFQLTHAPHRFWELPVLLKSLSVKSLSVCSFSSMMVKLWDVTSCV